MVTSTEEYISEKLNKIVERYQEIENLLMEPEVLSDLAAIQKYSKEKSDLSEIVKKYNAYKDLLQEIGNAEDIINDKTIDDDMRELASIELSDLTKKRDKFDEELRLLLIPKDHRDDKSVFLEIRAGTGGDEASLFASELFRMYTRFAEKKRWKVELVSSSQSDLGGAKEIISSIEGKGVYSFLKYESGVHRVQRVPVTDAGGRIHTSTVTVAVMPEAEEIDIQIDQKDLRIDTFCSSGPGGQSVNTTYSAVRIMHIPSGIAISCQDERSQLKNKAKAMKILRSRLLEAERERQDKEISDARKSQVGSGDRSEKIRTYNFPQNRVTDHRIGLTLHKLEFILSGNIEDIVESLKAADNAEKLKNIHIN